MTTRPPVDPGCLLSPQDDRRTFHRFALDMLVFVRMPQAPVVALGDLGVVQDARLYTFRPVAIRDMSMTGFFFYSALPYPSGADMEVCLCLEGVEFTTEGTVRRRVRINNQLCGFGVHFRQSRTSKELRAALAAFLLRQAGESR